MAFPVALFFNAFFAINEQRRVMANGHLDRLLDISRCSAILAEFDDPCTNADFQHDLSVICFLFAWYTCLIFIS